jgi:AraC family transcriptional regulator
LLDTPVYHLSTRIACRQRNLDIHRARDLIWQIHALLYNQTLAQGRLSHLLEIESLKFYQRNCNMSAMRTAANLYGKGVKSHKVGAFTLSERVYPAYFQTPRHSHEQALFCFVMQGGYTETYGSRTRDCEPSTFLFHAPGESHAEQFYASGGCSFIVEIEPQWLERLAEHSRVINTSVDFDGGIITLLATRLYKEFQEMDDISPLIIEGLMLEMLGETLSSARNSALQQPPRWLQQARQLIHERFAEQITLAEIAKTVGVHPVHLSQVFHKHYHCTVGLYLRQRRIEFACQRLASNNISLSEIALAAGFSDQSHLTRMFKRHMGIPPSQYRELLRKS